MKIIVLSFLFITLNTLIWGQDNHYRLEEYDVLKYNIYLKADPRSPSISVVAQIDIEFKSDLETLYLDLYKKEDNEKKGMHIQWIVDTKYNDTLRFEHKEEEVRIRSIRFKKGYKTTLKIHYSGIPKDGLIISKNKFLKPTIFADNWPNRGHHWLISNDHPSDKALWEITVETPKEFKVISNGALHKDSLIQDSIRWVKYVTTVPLPTKVLVVGIADFAVDSAGYANETPVTSWVFPENAEKGFYDYAQAVEVLNWFIEKIGEYPYQKLANVQSKTIFGGMENAGCIFYFENSVTGRRNHEDLLAHEIAHQWFGNSASETDWAHLWLSEGFATYLTDLYILDKYGEEEFQKRLKKERNKVRSFAKRNDSPVVNPTKDYMSLLNAYSYQKGAWVLHMLRKKLGPTVFWDVLKTYYSTYRLSNAATKDFFAIAEEISGQDLSRFMNQWLFWAEIPKLKIDEKIKGKKVFITIEQMNKEVFELPLSLRIIGKKGGETYTVDLKNRSHSFSYKTKYKVQEVQIDPNFELLFDQD